MSEGGRLPGRWRRVESLFDRLIDLDPAERSAALGQETDEDVRREVESLLDAVEGEGPMDVHLGEVAGELAQRAAAEGRESSIETGRTLGAWRIVEPLGDGGMGRVFLVERHAGDFEQAAALKLLRWELASPAMVERFENERRALAKLEHPGIARLIDGGVSEEGLPYLVVELVDGRPIDRYCQEETLDVPARLGLFLEVCDAVHAAHRRLIVHRDLKPSNILVTRSGRVRLLDFGVAKFLEDSATASPTQTRLAPATPGYAAPEQLTGDEVTTATDVYALGALLYELLTSRKPIEVNSTDPARIARAVLEIDPQRPSSVVQGRPAARLRGDLDNIALTALRKEPERRYPSVDRLAADVKRFLEDRPVEATPETLAYRMSKLVRRNRVAVGATALLILALAVGLGATAWQASRARQETAKAQRVADFLSSLLSSANPYNRDEPAHSLEDVLRAAAERLETELVDQPEVRAALLSRVGTGFYRLLRHDEEAWELLTEAESLLEERGESALLAEVRLEKALLAAERGEYDLQRQLAQRSRDYFANAEGPGAEGVGRALLVEAGALRYQGSFEEADRVGREALSLIESLPVPPPLLVAQALGNLGTIAEMRGERREAIDLLQRSLAMFESAGGSYDPDVIAVYDELGISYHALGLYDEAERSYRRAIELHEERFGPNHPNAIEQLTDLSRLLLDQGRFDEALHFSRRAVEASSGLSEADFERIATHINLATAELETGAVQSAALRYRSALESFLALLDEEHPAVARVRSLLADALRLEGEAEQAEVLYRLALHPQNRRLDEAWMGLGRVLADSGRSEEATGLFEQTLIRRAETLPEGHWRIVEVEAELARLEVRNEQGAEARAALADALASLERALGPVNWRIERLAGRSAA